MRVSTLIVVSVLQLAFANSPDKTLLDDFVNAQLNLQQGIADYCNGKNDLPKQQWNQTATLWFLVQGLQLPATAFLQAEYLFVFWPDSKDRLKRQVNTAITLPADEIDQSDLPSAALSLSAIEYIFTLDEPQDDCEWLSLVSQYQVSNALELQKLQNVYGFDGAAHVTALHSSALLLHSVLKEITVRSNKTLWVLGPGWRCGAGPEITNALLEQTAQLLAAYKDELDSVEHWLVKLEALPTISAQTNAETLNMIRDTSLELATYVETELAQHLDVFIGFNNFDGD